MAAIAASIEVLLIESVSSGIMFPWMYVLPSLVAIHDKQQRKKQRNHFKNILFMLTYVNSHRWKTY